MSAPGDADLVVRARAALLDALEALVDHRDALVLIGAQAIYLHTGHARVALAEATKDSDLAVDPRTLGDEPLIEDAMAAAGFHRDLMHPQPGSWLSPGGIPVDLMVPESLAGSQSRRGARIAPHDRHATRRARGLEAAMVDHAPMTIEALDPDDRRRPVIAVAGPAALLVAKLHKLGERRSEPGRLIDKDAHDIYRLLVATTTESLGKGLSRLATHDLAGPPTTTAMQHLGELFSNANSPGSLMAGRAEEIVGDPAVVSASVAALAGDVLRIVARATQ